MWSKKIEVPLKPVVYPPWTIVSVEDEYFLLLEKSKLKFISARAAFSWQKNILKSSSQALENYTTWKQVGFSLGSRLSTINNERYVICGSNPIETEYRRIATPDIFKLGFQEKDFIMISDSELKFHKKGEDIDGI